MTHAKDLETKLHEYLATTHAMERSMLRQLGALISTTDDEQIRAALEQHRAQTQEQIERLEERLEDHYEEPWDLKEVSAQFSAFFKALADVLRADKPVKNARDVFVTEHLEIAAYEILERLAVRAGDPKTALVARENRAAEEAMARTIAANWDRVVDDMLAEEGLLDQVTAR
jgi:ferritin-like metal-binding protein YciE